MSRIFLVVGSMTFLLAPLLACAKETPAPAATFRTVWDFRTGRPSSGTWDVTGLSNIRPSPEGLFVRTTTEGRIARVSDVTHLIHAIRIVVRDAMPGHIALRWHRTGTPPDAFSQLPFIVEGKEREETIDVDLSFFEAWDPRADRVGLVFPAGSDMIVEKMELYGWSAFGRITEAARSFWTFDTLMPYSINYLWGPRLSFNTLGRIHMFETQPPRGWSGNRAIYAVLLAAGIILFALWYFRRRELRVAPFTMFLCVFALVWMLLDLRMGLELFSYVRADAASYAFRKPGLRTLRNFENFHAMLDRSRPHIEKETSYAFLSPEGKPYLSHMRYFTYPAVPLALNNLEKHPHLWIVFDRPDIRINERRELSIGTGSISPPGEILERFDGDSFLFQTQ